MLDIETELLDNEIKFKAISDYRITMVDAIKIQTEKGYPLLSHNCFDYKSIQEDNEDSGTEFTTTWACLR